MEYQNYNSVPWYRKSGISSWFVFLGWFLFPPLIWIVAYALASGDIYYKESEQDGNLKKWSKANKVVAWIIIVANILFFINILF
jgi:heme/copper-type cytochrome/quinol oxidase subunit 2